MVSMVTVVIMTVVAILRQVGFGGNCSGSVG